MPRNDVDTTPYLKNIGYILARTPKFFWYAYCLQYFCGKLPKKIFISEIMHYSHITYKCTYVLASTAF